MWYQLLYLALLVWCLIYAVWRGGAPERIAIAIMVVGSVASTLVIAHGFRHVELGLLTIDLADQVALTILMLTADRYWLMPMVGVHLLEIAAALAKGLVPIVEAGAYARVEQAIGYILLMLIAVGVKRHQERRRRYGVDPSWSTSLPRSVKNMRSGGQMR